MNWLTLTVERWFNESACDGSPSALEVGVGVKKIAINRGNSQDAGAVYLIAGGGIAGVAVFLNTFGRAPIETYRIAIVTLFLA